MKTSWLTASIVEQLREFSGKICVEQDARDDLESILVSAADLIEELILEKSSESC